MHRRRDRETALTTLLWTPLVIAQLGWTILSGHPDAAILARHAQLHGVPIVLVWAVAARESGYRGGNHWRGPGKWVADTVSPDSVILRRICREVGRMQLNPCFPLTWLDPWCTNTRVRTSYDANISCGVKYLASHGPRISRYNGRGPMAREYQRWIESEIGRILLRLGGETLDSLLHRSS